MKTDRALKQKAVYVILGYDINGEKDILGIWINETEGKHTWMQISMKSRTGEYRTLVSSPWMVSAALKKALLPSSLAQWCNAALSI